jgi:hypothetical protein
VKTHSIPKPVMHNLVADFYRISLFAKLSAKIGILKRNGKYGFIVLIIKTSLFDVEGILIYFLDSTVSLDIFHNQRS